MIKKLCPILILANYVAVPGYPNTVCLESECAWWNGGFDCCGLVASAKIMDLEFARREADED